MARLAMLLALIGLAYWYWSGPHQRSTSTSAADQLRENAATMQRCINQEQRMQSTGGLAGLADIGSSGLDAEKLCAEKYQLLERDGHWYRRAE